MNIEIDSTQNKGFFVYAHTDVPRPPSRKCDFLFNKDLFLEILLNKLLRKEGQRFN